jgi:hypothetical protein
MSANLCSIRTLNALATFAADKNIQLCLNNGDVLQCMTNPQNTVDLLLSANLASLRTRYPQDADYKQPHAATFTAARREEVAPVVILKLVNYYNYQACEADGYQGSDAAALMRNIITNAIRALPGYASSPWGLDGDEPRPVLPAPPAVVNAPRDLLALLLPNGPVALDDAHDAPALQPINRATLTSMGPAATKATKPTPKASTKPNASRQPRGPF